MESPWYKKMFILVFAIAGILILWGLYARISGDPSGLVVILAGCGLGLSGIIMFISLPTQHK